jgi:hypothetical protein
MKVPIVKSRPMTLDERKIHGLADDEVATHFYTEWVDVRFWNLRQRLWSPKGN